MKKLDIERHFVKHEAGHLLVKLPLKLLECWVERCV